jgi:hypothetical protein
MKRTPRLLLLSLLIAGSITGVALAASSPTVVTRAATKVTDTTAILNGAVNPNGNHTDYIFSYGPTTAYGAGTDSRSVGGGTKSVAVARTVTGLTPGTTYHFRITALNGAGSSVGADRAFTTTGHPPAAVVTGSAANVGKTGATVTGSINPEGAATSWGVQYGLTTTYGVQTIPLQILAGVATPVPVSLNLSGLAPGTLFHYEIVAYHPSGLASIGGDQTFFTEPSTRPQPKLTAHTSPSHDAHAPYAFTTSGTLGGATSIPAAQRCAGNVGIRYYNGTHQLAFVVAPVGANCKFSVGASFRKLHGAAPAAVRVNVDYRGTGYVAPAIRTDHVSAG